MSKLTPQEAQEKHARNLKNSVEDMKLGIRRVTEAPGIAAGRQEDKMKQNLLASIEDGSWRRGVEKVSLQEWQDKTIKIGVPRISAGIDAAKDKTTDFFGQLFDHQDRLLPKIDQMPDLSFEDSLNRMTEWSRGMREFRKQ